MPLDETTLNQMKDIDQDNRLNALSEKHAHELNAVNKHIVDLQFRLKTLEDARQVQILLNNQYSNDIRELKKEPKAPLVTHKTFWDFLK